MRFSGAPVSLDVKYDVAKDMRIEGNRLEILSSNIETFGSAFIRPNSI